MHAFVLALCVSVALFALLARADGPRTECVEIDNAKAGESCASLEGWSGVSVADIEQMNPGIDCDAPFTQLTPVCLRQYTPTCALWEPATQPNCQNLLAQWSLTQEQFLELNDNVDDSCTLVVGNQYCVTTDGCVADPENPFCQQ